MFSLESYNQYKTIAAYLFGGWALLTFLGIIPTNSVLEHLSVVSRKCSGRSFGYRDMRRMTSYNHCFIQRRDSEDSEESDQEHMQEMVNPSWNTPHFRKPLIESAK